VLRVAFALVLLCLALSGCGTADDRDQARAATERFYDAVRHHDGAAACAELTEPAAQTLEDQEGKDCAQAVTELDLKGGAVTGVEVYVTNAKVDLAEHVTAYLDRGPSGWKLSAVSCAHGAKPADHPANCELEA
jgi:uncharacterized protein YceK